MTGSRPLDPNAGFRQTDAVLMQLMKADSTVAFAELYRRHVAQALRVAQASCRGSGVAEEAVQDAFEAIWRSRATYRADRGPVRAWAMAIVRHRTIAVSRSRGLVLPVLIGGRTEPSTPADQSVDDAVAGEESRQLLDLLARLPPAQKEVIALAFYGQLTHAEIADRLDLPAGTVKGRMRLGIGKLRDGLERTGS